MPFEGHIVTGSWHFVVIKTVLNAVSLGVKKDAIVQLVPGLVDLQFIEHLHLKDAILNPLEVHNIYKDSLVEKGAMRSDFEFVEGIGGVHIMLHIVFLNLDRFSNNLHTGNW